jgi:hypothetical protein
MDENEQPDVQRREARLPSPLVRTSDAWCPGRRKEKEVFELAMKVQLKRRSSNYRDLSTGHVYTVWGIEADDFRILNDCGRPYLYPAKIFKLIDSGIPADWIIEYGGRGEKYAYPRLLNRPGFFEEFFDGVARTQKAFWRFVNDAISTSPAS